MIDLTSEFDGKVMLIIGGTDGIGVAAARRFGRPGEVKAGIRGLCPATASYVVNLALVIDGGLAG